MKYPGQPGRMLLVPGESVSPAARNSAAAGCLIQKAPPFDLDWPGSAKAANLIERGAAVGFEPTFGPIRLPAGEGCGPSASGSPAPHSTCLSYTAPALATNLPPPRECRFSGGARRSIPAPARLARSGRARTLDCRAYRMARSMPGADPPGPESPLTCPPRSSPGFGRILRKPPLCSCVFDSPTPSESKRKNRWNRRNRVILLPPWPPHPQPFR